MMKSKRFVNVGAVAAAILATSGVGLTPTASASDVTMMVTAGFDDWSGTRVQVDNDPGNGAGAWVWLYATTDDGQTHAKYKRSMAQIKYSDGSWGPNLVAESGKTATMNVPRDVKDFRICNYYNDWSYCSAWVTM